MRKTTFIALIAVLSLFFNTGCKKQTEVTDAPAPAFDLSATKLTIVAGYREFEKAYNAKDSVALTNCYATDAKFMAPNMQAAEGKDNILKMFGQMLKGDTTKINLRLVELWGDENNVTAENAWTISDKDGKVLDEGKSIEVYKMEDGKWKLLRDCFNSNLPAMPMKK